MQVLNQSRGTVVADRAAEAATPWSRMRGLLGRKGLDAGEGLVIRPCQGVHTFWMAFPIDVLHVGRDGAVRKILPAMPPNRMGPVDFGCSYVVELPAGAAERAGVQVGDHLELRR
jgi:uncharacterized membrane protein (UPF0127 family)